MSRINGHLAQGGERRELLSALTIFANGSQCETAHFSLLAGRKENGIVNKENVASNTGQYDAFYALVLSLSHALEYVHT